MEKDPTYNTQEAAEKPLPPTPPPSGGGEWQDTSAEGTPQSGEPNANGHGECCEECKKTCKRNFWTELLRTVVKVSTIVLAAFGISSFDQGD